MAVTAVLHNAHSALIYKVGALFNTNVMPCHAMMGADPEVVARGANGAT